MSESFSIEDVGAILDAARKLSGQNLEGQKLETSFNSDEQVLISTLVKDYGVSKEAAVLAYKNFKAQKVIEETKKLAENRSLEKPISIRTRTHFWEDFWKNKKYGKDEPWFSKNYKIPEDERGIIIISHLSNLNNYLKFVGSSLNAVNRTLSKIDSIKITPGNIESSNYSYNLGMPGVSHYTFERSHSGYGRNVQFYFDCKWNGNLDL
jgi:hypothetical protein